MRSILKLFGKLEEDRRHARQRSSQPSRLESFSDAVFGFALTLLVLTTAVPGNFRDLLALVRGLPAFGCSFLLFVTIWARHSRYFRHYALEDRTTVVLNSFLLFVVLFYVYPLKFMFDFSFALFRGQNPYDLVAAKDIPKLMALFFAGVMAVETAFGLLYLHAYRMRHALELARPEERLTLTNASMSLLMVTLGSVTLVLVLTLPPHIAWFAFFTLWLSWPAAFLIRSRIRKELPDEPVASPAVESAE